KPSANFRAERPSPEKTPIVPPVPHHREFPSLNAPLKIRLDNSPAAPALPGRKPATMMHPITRMTIANFGSIFPPPKTRANDLSATSRTPRLQHPISAPPQLLLLSALQRGVRSRSFLWP